MSDIYQIAAITKNTAFKNAFIREQDKYGMQHEFFTNWTDLNGRFSVRGLPHAVLIEAAAAEEDLGLIPDLNIYAALPLCVVDLEKFDSEAYKKYLLTINQYIGGEDPVVAMVAVIRALQRETSFLDTSGPEVKINEDVAVNLVDKYVIVRGQRVDLTPTEVSLLHALMRFAGTMVDSQTLIDLTWRGADEGNPNALRVHMHRLRRKIGWRKRQQDSLIRTVREVGYKLQG